MKESEDRSCLLSILAWFVFVICAMIIGTILLIIFPLTEECRKWLPKILGTSVILLYWKYSYIVKKWLKNTFYKSND